MANLDVSQIIQAFQVSRDLAKNSQYDEALLNYDSLLNEIQTYLKNVNDVQEKVKWERIKKMINLEIKLIKDLINELQQWKVFNSNHLDLLRLFSFSKFLDFFTTNERF